MKFLENKKNCLKKKKQQNKKPEKGKSGSTRVNYIHQELSKKERTTVVENLHSRKQLYSDGDCRGGMKRLNE